MVDDDIRLLRDAGHEVLAWTPEPVRPERQGTIGLARTSLGSLWSRRASAQLRRFVRDRRPDVVHVHNLYPMLSPTVLRTAHDLELPAVMTLHNYRLLCLPATLERDGSVCERCVGHLPWQGVRFRCYRGSAAGSAVVATSLTLHRSVGSFDMVSRFLPVSGFVLDKYVEAGFEAARMRVRENFAWDAPRRQGAGDYFLYAGRLSREKGVENLLKAWDPNLGHLVIAGTGPEEARLRAAEVGGVEFAGALSPEALRGVVAGARAMVVPSIGYETSGKVVMEAFASGVPVIASRIGALPEAVEDGISGLLVAPEDPRGWASAIRALGDDATSVRLGAGAIERWRQRYAPARGLEGLEAAYEAAIGG